VAVSGAAPDCSSLLTAKQTFPSLFNKTLM